MFKIFQHKGNTLANAFVCDDNFSCICRLVFCDIHKERNMQTVRFQNVVTIQYVFIYI